MSENNFEIWDKVSHPPASALKQIGGGRLKGMTDISPQWRLQALTEVFGPIGDFWGYEITELRTDAFEGEVVATVQVSLWYGTDGEGNPTNFVPGIGSSKLVEVESKGPHVNDEAWKSALTDALSVAMKQLGVGAAIYMGLWDGSKYNDKGGGNGVDKDMPKLKAALEEGKKAGVISNEQMAKVMEHAAGVVKTRADYEQYIRDTKGKIEKKKAEKGEQNDAPAEGSPSLPDDRGQEQETQPDPIEEEAAAATDGNNYPPVTDPPEDIF